MSGKPSTVNEIYFQLDSNQFANIKVWWKWEKDQSISAKSKMEGLNLRLRLRQWKIQNILLLKIAQQDAG